MKMIVMSMLALLVATGAQAAPGKKMHHAEAAAASSHGSQNMAGCGLGSMVIQDNTKWAQVGAAFLNGTGFQTFSNGAYGSCVAQKCDVGYTASNGDCQAIPPVVSTKTFGAGKFVAIPQKVQSAPWPIPATLTVTFTNTVVAGTSVSNGDLNIARSLADEIAQVPGVKSVRARIFENARLPEFDNKAVLVMGVDILRTNALEWSISHLLAPAYTPGRVEPAHTGPCVIFTRARS